MTKKTKYDIREEATGEQDERDAEQRYQADGGNSPESPEPPPETPEPPEPTEQTAPAEIAVGASEPDTVPPSVQGTSFDPARTVPGATYEEQQ